jgi:hypothetical protein
MQKYIEKCINIPPLNTPISHVFTKHKGVWPSRAQKNILTCITIKTIALAQVYNVKVGHHIVKGSLFHFYMCWNVVSMWDASESWQMWAWHVAILGVGVGGEIIVLCRNREVSMVVVIIFHVFTMEGDMAPTIERIKLIATKTKTIFIPTFTSKNCWKWVVFWDPIKIAFTFIARGS